MILLMVVKQFTMGVDTYVGFEATTQFLKLSTHLKLVLFLSSFYSTELLSVLHEDSLFSSSLDAVDSPDVELSLRMEVSLFSSNTEPV